MTYKATIGSISHGTLRTIDLLESFSHELNLLAPDHALVIEANAAATLINADWTYIADSEEAGELINEMIDILSEHAPPYTYFGAHEGDGSDFGFWPSLESIEELPHVSDPNEVESIGADCVYVNDHGNVTVYAADGSVIWDCV